MPPHFVTGVTELAPLNAHIYAPGLMVRCTTSRIVKSRPDDTEADMTTTDTQNAVRHYPIAGVCTLFGVPRRDWHLFSRWAEHLPAPKATDELYVYVDVMIADRCRKSGQDLLSHLIQFEVDGNELTTDDLRVIVAALVAGACCLTS
jgi:cytochrome P450